MPTADPDVGDGVVASTLAAVPLLKMKLGFNRVDSGGARHLRCEKQSARQAIVPR
jgi:hypothetical protein